MHINLLCSLAAEGYTDTQLRGNRNNRTSNTPLLPKRYFRLVEQKTRDRNSTC